MRSLAATLFLMLMAETQIALGQSTRSCTREDAIRAEEESPTLENWSEVYKSFINYAHCDEAAIGEGYGGSIVRLLSEQWDTIEVLNKFTSKDKRFERFVLVHIDQLMLRSEAEKILRNATADCPTRTRRLCRSIAAKARYEIRNWTLPPR